MEKVSDCGSVSHHDNGVIGSVTLLMQRGEACAADEERADSSGFTFADMIF